MADDCYVQYSFDNIAAVQRRDERLPSIAALFPEYVVIPSGKDAHRGIVCALREISIEHGYVCYEASDPMWSVPEFGSLEELHSRAYAISFTLPDSVADEDRPFGYEAPEGAEGEHASNPIIVD